MATSPQNNATETTSASAAATPVATPRLTAGQTAPGFSLQAVNPDGSETTVSLTGLTAAGKSVLLYFYPAAMTPGCTTEACDFRDNIARLGTLGYTVLGVSKDPLDKLQRFREKEHLSFPLMSDPDLTVHRAYGAYGEKKLYGKVHVGVIRSTFAIDAHGVITLARYNVRAKGHVESLLKTLGKAAER
ncbi:peroxiredoxin [Bifidobacterium leontopitheci]|uniref:thioredoxin-dependent peroxiredoxin n=1 Tax=Bifidobacterium leontopitheci TaxID=2650774 RepID=A0A6I1GEG4_9BIFI|nr:peroxiredoxin [Bifidobacterium leontopitheci]KAB7790020.1 peroxiredoxin [Bifidobacterium leontopitheci]